MNTCLSGDELTDWIHTKVSSDPDVIDLSVGELPFAPPVQVQEFLCSRLSALQNHCVRSAHCYADPGGVGELKEAISRYYRKRYGLSVYADSQVLITHGATEAIWLAIATLTQPGDTVVISDPSYMMYGPLVQTLNRVPVRVPFREQAYDHWEGLLQQASLVLLNSPENPTGQVYSVSFMTRILELAQKYSFYVVHDEVYDCFVYEGNHTPILALDTNVSHSVIINSVSKRFGMGGWRLGWAIGDSKIITEAKKLHYYMNMSECHIGQEVIASVLTDSEVEQQVSSQAHTLHKRGTRFLMDLIDLGIVDDETMPPESGFYLFAKVKTLSESLDLPVAAHKRSAGEIVAQFLLERYKIAVGPGIGFGPSGEDYVRVSFAAPESLLSDVISRLANTRNLVR